MSYVPWVILSGYHHGVDASLSCYYMTSFNYDGKKARDVDLTYRCHLSNVMPGSIFYDSVGWGMTQFLFGVVVFLFFINLFSQWW